MRMDALDKYGRTGTEGREKGRERERVISQRASYVSTQQGLFDRTDISACSSQDMAVIGHSYGIHQGSNVMPGT